MVLKTANEKMGKAGYHTVEFAVRKLLEEAKERGSSQYHLNPKTFGKEMKEIDINDSNGELNRLEKERYKRQLQKILKYFEDDEWECEESNGKDLKLIFRREI